MGKEAIQDDIKKVLRDTFKKLTDDVAIEVFTLTGTNDAFNDASVALVKAVAELSPNIKASFHTVGDDQSLKRGVQRSPTILIAPDKYRIRYTGSPLGEEGRSFILGIIMASTKGVALSEDSLARLLTLKDERAIQVFVSPTCPYCPQEAIFAISAAIARPELVSAEIVEIYENKDIAEDRAVVSVPQTFINGVLTSPGAEPEEFFIESLISLKRPEIMKGPVSDSPVEKDVLVIGAGPAGLTAAIYAERSGLRCVVIEKEMIGGQIAITPVVENYPGFTKISGKSLVDLIAQQALQYTDIHLSEEVVSIERGDDRFKVSTNRAIYLVRGIIITSGASSRELGVPGERRFWGRGVSYCAECDGYFFRDGKKVLIVGGGNTAATDALYLHSLGAQVTIIHRRDKLRAQKRLLDGLEAAGIPILWESEVREILGERTVKSVKIEDRRKGTAYELPVDGVFIAIGYKPNSKIAAEAGVTLDDFGYIKVDDHQRTTIPGIYAAGDITGGVKQIVVAVGQGSVAAISVFEDLSNPYWTKPVKEESAKK